jgi:hypothetical protein
MFLNATKKRTRRAQGDQGATSRFLVVAWARVGGCRGADVESRVRLGQTRGSNLQARRSRPASPARSIAPVGCAAWAGAARQAEQRGSCARGGWLARRARERPEQGALDWLLGGAVQRKRRERGGREGEEAQESGGGWLLLAGRGRA